MRHSQPATMVAREINQRLRGMTVCCDSWYHDCTWPSRLFDVADSSPSFRLEDLRTLQGQAEAES